MSPASSKLSLRRIFARYGDITIVRGLDLEVGEGEFVSLLGPSGCGKSTTLRLIAGLETPVSGDILISGKSILSVPIHKRSMGIVFQDYALFPHMTVGENVAYGLRMRGVSSREQKSRSSELISIVGLSHVENRFPKELSGGQRQRVALARALAIKPAVLLLDEPFAALDRHLRLKMQSDLREIQKEFKISTIFVTHDQEEALAMSDRIALMSNGEIVDIGAPRTVFDNPACLFSLDFIGGRSTLPVKVLGHGDPVPITLDSGQGVFCHVNRTLEFDSGKSAKLAMRATQIRVRDQPLSEHTCVRATIKSKTFIGDSTEYVLDINGQVVESKEPAFTSINSDVGDSVFACWKYGDGWLIN